MDNLDQAQNHAKQNQPNQAIAYALIDIARSLRRIASKPQR